MNGLTVGSWTLIDHCDITHTTLSAEVEFQFGGPRTGVTLSATERGLERLLEVGTAALAELKAKRDNGDDEQ